MQLWERSDIGYVQVIQTHFSSLMTFLVRHMTLADYLVLADRRVEKLARGEGLLIVDVFFV